MTAKEKRIRDRLQQIKDSASAAAMNAKSEPAIRLANLAEEAAGLGLEVLEEKK